MRAITKDQEKILDNAETLIIDDEFIPLNNIINYGVVDLNYINNEFVIAKNKLIIHTGLDYNTGICMSNDDGYYLKNDLGSKLNYFKEHLCYIGNPERIIIYNRSIDKETWINGEEMAKRIINYKTTDLFTGDPATLKYNTKTGKSKVKPIKKKKDKIKKTIINNKCNFKLK